jgi:predicted AAA+ superfamily ATPase
MNWLFSLKDKRPIKVITGVRRCGKSTLLEMYKEELLKQGVESEQIQSINLEDDSSIPLLNNLNLTTHIKNNMVKDKKNYVFLDEIHKVSDFGKVADWLYINGNFDVYITGSTSHMQSTNLARAINREKLTLGMLPLSFKEFFSAWFQYEPEYNPLSHHRIEEIHHEPLREIALNDYISYSSFPFVLGCRTSSRGDGYFDGWDNNRVHEYLTDIIDKIIKDDIAENKQIAETNRLQMVVKFMAENISKELSIKNIANTMTSKGFKTEHKTIEGFFEAFCDSFLFHKVGRYEIKGKEQLANQAKYYLVDVGLRRALLGDTDTGRGNILENLVYLELLRRGYRVYVGIYKNKEIDFVAQGNNGIEYYQVADSVSGEKTFEREYKALDSIRDHYPKFILARNYGTAVDNGIKIKNIIDWLLDTP